MIMAETPPRSQTGPTSAELGELKQRFQAREAEARLVNYRRGAILAIIFTISGTILDWIMYPQSLSVFFMLRLLACCLVGGVLVLLYVPKYQPMARQLGHLVAFIPMSALLWLLAWIDDGSSPYYAGLNLIMVGAVLVMRWRAGDSVINALFCIGGYLGVSLCLGHQPADIVVATFFLSVTAVFACVGLFLYNRLRFREFCLREEVAAQQTELAEGARDVEVKSQALNSALEEIKENEARLLAAEKMSSLGRMSAGIVHEVNNPLNYAKTALHALRMYSDDVAAGEREDFEETVSDAEDGVNRVIRIVSDLRSFTKGETIMHEEVRVAETIEMARRLVGRDLRGIEFTASIPGDLMVAGNSNQLCQVFVNVIQNSVQALEEDGNGSGQPRLDISCGEVKGGQVVMAFRDNGPGIAPEDLEHVFDPFFTRREVGEGMGLGLSICHQIVESHGGKIEVVSTPGEFTEFRVVLPRYWDQARDRARPEQSDYHKVETEKASLP